jgi:hypothetical protein
VQKTEDNYRLKTKVEISIVHGRGVWYYVVPENIHGGPNTVRTH